MHHGAGARESESVAAYVGLGSNQGDSAGIIGEASAALARLPGVRPGPLSSVYRTEPQGLAEQPFFLNRAAALLCPPTLAPEALLDMLQELERRFGRERRAEVRFGPRRLDLDLLLFGNKDMKSSRLTLPHPRLLERAFVLLPLAEIAPDLPLPGGMTPRRVLARLNFRLEGGTIYQNGGARA